MHSLDHVVSQRLREPSPWELAQWRAAVGSERADWSRILDEAGQYVHDEVTLRMQDSAFRKLDAQKKLWCMPAPGVAGAGPRISVFRSLFLKGASAATTDTYWDADFVTTDGGTGKLLSWVDYLDNTHLLTQASSANQCALPSTDASLGGAKSATFVQASASYYDGSRAISAYDYLSDGISGATTYIVLVPGTFVAADYTFATTGNTTQGYDCYRSGTGAYQSRVRGGTAGETTLISGVVAGTATYLEMIVKEGATAEMSGRLKNGSATTHSLDSATGAQVALRVGARPVTASLACNMRLRSIFSFRRELLTAHKTIVQAQIQKETGVVP